jgi:hypothetical protein
MRREHLSIAGVRTGIALARRGVRGRTAARHCEAPSLFIRGEQGCSPFRYCCYSVLAFWAAAASWRRRRRKSRAPTTIQIAGWDSPGYTVERFRHAKSWTTALGMAFA